MLDSGFSLLYKVTHANQHRQAHRETAVTNAEKQKLIERLRIMRDRLRAPKPADMDALAFYARLCGAAAVLLDDALITLSS
jgi:hypothetical protein